MKIVTWNVNSVRARQERLLALLARHDPDVVCLQEIKVVEEGFPAEPLEQLGYHSAVFGQKTYNGVAVLSKLPAASVERGFGKDDPPDEPQARAISVRIDGVLFVCVYVPNGGSLESDRYRFKLEWLRRLVEYLSRATHPDDAVVVLGDFNVAPEDIDVHDPDAWRGALLCSDAEREALHALHDWGLRDAFRELYPDKAAFTWWDYRALGFPLNKGLRIDHVWMTRTVLDRCRSVDVDREERKGKGPSDHAPVIAVLNDPAKGV